MGYHTRFRGDLTIEPPLTWPEIQRSPCWPGHPDHNNTGWGKDRYGAVIKIEEDTVETPEGTLIRRSGHRVEIEGDELRADGVLDDLRGLARLYGADHRFVGHLTAEGEEAADVWRVRIDGTSVVEVEPVLLWPGDEKAETIVATTLRRTLGVEWPDEALTVARRILHDLTDLNRKK